MSVDNSGEVFMRALEVCQRETAHADAERKKRSNCIKDCKRCSRHCRNQRHVKTART